jgi:heat-inducible transcriptional repressor
VKTTVELGELPGRLGEVLVAVLRGYVDTGQPIGSRDALGRGRARGVLGDRARAMAELMELGLLEQPHRRPGADRRRVPALGRSPAARAAGRAAHAGAAARTGRVDEQARAALQRAADVLTEVTGQLGFSLAHEREGSRLVQLHFVRVSSERVTALLIAEGGTVRTRLFEERESDQRRLDRISAELSQLVAGLTLEEARARLHAEIEGDRRRRDALWRETLSFGARGLEVDAAAPVELFVGDRSRLRDQPEFADAERLREALRALDEKQRLLALLDKLISARGVRVAIGEELGDPGVIHCAVVAEQIGPEPRCWV